MDLPSTEVRQLLKASYSPITDQPIGEWTLDKSISKVKEEERAIILLV